MTLPLPADELLLSRLLDRTEEIVATSNAEHPEADLHPDEESLALFADGLLAPGDRTVVVQHLSVCSSCRSLIGLLWKSAEEGIQTIAVPATVQRIRDAEPAGFVMRAKSDFLRSVICMAAVASLVLMAVITWRHGSNSAMVAEQRAYHRAEQLLASADFGDARRVLENADRSGVRSGRLLSLNLQALRELPGSMSLESAGTLMDFGYDLEGTLSRDITEKTSLKKAAAILDTKQAAAEEHEPIELILNRGHLRLSQNDVAAAVLDFRKATVLEPNQPLAWLGLGLAEFARNDFNKAEEAFQHCLRLAPELTSAHINLAMTLEELGRIDDARDKWQLVLALQPTVERRNQIERHLEGLK